MALNHVMTIAHRLRWWARLLRPLAWVTAYSGLYFLGMPWLHSRRSGILFGVGDDAAYLAEHIAAREADSADLSQWHSAAGMLDGAPQLIADRYLAENGQNDWQI